MKNYISGKNAKPTEQMLQFNMDNFNNSIRSHEEDEGHQLNKMIEGLQKRNHGAYIQQSQPAHSN